MGKGGEGGGEGGIERERDAAREKQAIERTFCLWPPGVKWPFYGADSRLAISVP